MKIIKPRAIISLVIVNLLTIVIALIQNWQISNVIWIFVVENFIIGVFNALRIQNLKNFKTKGLRINNRILPKNPSPSERIEIKSITTKFFLMHYGGFNAFYIIFLLAWLSDGLVIFSDPLFYFLLIAFIFNHWISFKTYLKDETKRNQSIEGLMFRPYIRIFPVHLLVLSGVFLIHNKLALIFFFTINLVCQLLGHYFEHWFTMKVNKK